MKIYIRERSHTDSF